MMLRQLPDVRVFIQKINSQLIQNKSDYLSELQIKFITICMSGMVLHGGLNFSAISRGTLEIFTVAGLSWMLRYSKINWATLVEAAVITVFETFGLSDIHIIVDDTDRARSKVIKAIFGVFKTVDKKTGGFFLAQNIVFVAIVTNKFTIPIFFQFYRPDPNFQAWKKNDKNLKKKGVHKKDRPAEPERNYHEYPSRLGIAIILMKKVQALVKNINNKCNSKIRVTSVMMDAAYMSPMICGAVKFFFPKAQFVSQIVKSQIVWDKTQKKHTTQEYFANKSPAKEIIKLRGEEKSVEYLSARLFVQSHGKILHIVALKYAGESDYRYLAASNLTWRTVDIIKIYSLRWLIEVAIEDWKQYDGWGRKASQQGIDGARRGVFLSLLVDCFLLLHPHQLHLFRTGQSLCTTGSLVRKIQFEAFLGTIEEIFESPDPKAEFQKMVTNFDNVITLRPSSKHMLGKDLGDFGPAPSLLYRHTG